MLCQLFQLFRFGSVSSGWFGLSDVDVQKLVTRKELRLLIGVTSVNVDISQPVNAVRVT